MAESHNSTEIRFYDPDMRGLIPLDNSLGDGLHVPRRLQRRVRQQVQALLDGVLQGVQFFLGEAGVQQKQEP